MGFGRVRENKESFAVNQGPDQPDDRDPPYDDFQRFEFVCPKCEKVLSEYAEACPFCGQNLFEVFSGTFRPKRRLGVRLVAMLALAAFVGAMIALFISSLRDLLQGTP